MLLPAYHSNELIMIPRWTRGKAFDKAGSSFLPINGLNRTDGDVTLVLLFNFAGYAEPVEDPWYKADDETGYVSGATRYKSADTISVVSHLHY